MTPEEEFWEEYYENLEEEAYIEWLDSLPRVPHVLRHVDDIHLPGDEPD